MGNTPNIRFKGFTNDWEQRKLGEISSSFEYGLNAAAKEYDGENKYIRITDIDDDSREFKQEDITSPDIDLSSAENYRLSEGDILFARTGASVGKSYIYKVSDGLVYYAGFLIRARIKSEYNAEFVFQNTLSGDYEKFIKVTSMRSGQPGVNAQEYSKYQIMVPSKPEQDKISDSFRSLDNLITLHQRKCDETKKLKKFMLQKMFPKKDAKKPEIRFAGFTDDWEQRKVLDLLIEPVTDGPHETPELVKKGVPFISVDAIVDNKIDFNRKRGDISEEYDAECCKKYKPQLHDVYLVKSGSTVGKVAIVETTERFNIWSPLAAMRCGEKTDPYFLYVLLQTDGMQAQISDKASNGTQPNLSMRELEKFDVQVPQNTDEQKAIGDYFINLDHLITLHRRAYYNKKGGLTNVHNDNQQHYAIL